MYLGGNLRQTSPDGTKCIQVKTVTTCMQLSSIPCHIGVYTLDDWSAKSSSKWQKLNFQLLIQLQSNTNLHTGNTTPTGDCLLKRILS